MRSLGMKVRITGTTKDAEMIIRRDLLMESLRRGFILK